MLTVIWVSLFIIVTASAIGAVLVRCLTWAGLVPLNEEQDPTEVFFAGLCIWGTLLNYWSLFGATNALVGMVSILLVLWYIIKYKDQFISQTLYPFYNALWNNNSKKLGILLLITVLLCAIIPPNNYDTSLYHIPAIKWIEQYAAVPGLGNLHGRFAFNPSIFVLHAATDFRAVFGVGVYALNAVFMGVFLLWLSAQINKATHLTNVAFYLMLIFLCLNTYIMQTSSATPDISSTILTCFVLLRTWQRQVNMQNENFVVSDWKNYLLLCIIICYAITIKLNAIPLLLLLPYIAWLCRKTITPRSVAIGLSLGVFVFLPWLIRNVILSGYLVYPLGIDIFNVDWKIPLDNVIDERNWIYSWARIPAKHWKEVLELPFSTWFPIWFGALNFLQKIIMAFLFGALPLGMAAAGIFYLYKIDKKERNLAILNDKMPWLITWTIAFIGCLYWFLTAPSFRFGGAYIWLAILMPLLSFSFLFIPIWLNKLREYLVLGFIIMLSSYYCTNAGAQLLGYSSWATGQTRTHAYSPLDYLWLPLPVEAISWKGDFSYKTHHIGSTVILQPQNENRCFDVSLPCTPILNPTLTMRGSSTAQGFRVSAAHPMLLSDF